MAIKNIARRYKAVIKTLENRKKSPFLEVLAVDALKTSKLSHENFTQKLRTTATSTTVILHRGSPPMQKRIKSIFCAIELQATAMNAPVK
jgi:hypothetical protein